MEKFPLVAVGAIVLDDGDILLVKRKHEPASGTWSLPGGKLQLGESLADAVVREVREETALTVSPKGVAGTIERIVRDDEGRTSHHFVIVGHWAAIVDREDPTAGDDAEDARWFAVDEITRLKMPPGLFEFLRDQDVMTGSLPSS